MRDTPIITWDGDISEVEQIGKAKPGKGKKVKKAYMDIITAFDIETTLLEVGGGFQSIMYHWQWQLGDKYTVIGRTWEEFINFYERLNAIAKEKDLVIPVFVHNLSYEFQFLWEILDLGNTANIFATSLRSVLYFEHKQFEFRCTKRLSNDSERHWCEELKVDHQKKELDYSIKRYPWTKLTEEELRYCVNDVIGLVECVEKQMHIYGDTIYSLPLTSTGYIRRMIKKEMYFIRDTVTNQINDLPIYRLLRNAYRGGNAHAGNSLTGNILENVVSYDRSSSYPDVMMHCKYPVTKFRKEMPTISEAIRLVKAQRALLMRVYITKLRIKKGNTCPYIGLSGCEKYNYVKPVNAVCDNGRVLKADLVEISLTDIDLKIIMDTYDFEKMEIIEMYSARYGELPYPIKEIIKQLYKNKTTMKGVEGMEIEYMKSKNLLNAVYGMMCQRAITPEVMIGISEDDEEGTPEYWKYDDKYDEEVEYEKYKKKAFLNYAWGVWVCAWARLRLQEGIEIAGYYNFIYCDTDSVKCLGNPDFTEYNEQRIFDAKKSGAYATDRKGKVHYMGVFEFEYKAEKFRTLGSKRYAYVLDGKLHVTVSGVSKETGSIELEQKGGIDAFVEKAVFEHSGHIAAHYNDHPNMELTIEGHRVRITSNTALVNTPYHLTIDPDYHYIIEKSVAAFERQRQPDLPYMAYDIDEWLGD